MLTSAELCLIADEITRTALPARVEKIHQPRPDGIVFRLSRGGAEHSLLVVASRRFARAHLVRDPPPNPQTPPQFCDDLRRLLQPGRIVGAATLKNDAVLVLDFEVKDAPGPRRVVAELFGAHPNILVVSADGVIEAVLVAREAKGRMLVVGERYVEPPPRGRDVAPIAPFSAFGESADGGSLSEMLERAVTAQEADALLGIVRDAFVTDVGHEEKKLARRLANIDADIRGADAIPTHRREGEILKANLGRLKRGMKEITLAEWTGEQEAHVRIVLDPKRTPGEEVSWRFDEARRLEGMKEAAAERKGEVAARLAKIAAWKERAAAATSEDAIAAIRDEAGLAERAPQQAPGKKAAPKIEPRKPYRTFLSKDGIEILVGRTARDNDELTFHVANGNDFWLHVRDYPGSHVVVRERDQLPEETLLDAATLAVHFSRGAAGGKREVSWTRRKFVSKARRAPPGQVLLSAHKSLMLRPDPDRLARLLRG